MPHGVILTGSKLDSLEVNDSHRFGSKVLKECWGQIDAAPSARLELERQLSVRAPVRTLNRVGLRNPIFPQL